MTASPTSTELDEYLRKARFRQVRSYDRTRVCAPISLLIFAAAFTKPLVTPLPASKSLELPDGFTPMKLRDGDKLRAALPGWMVDAKGTPYFHPLNDYWKNLISYYGASALVKSFPGTPLEDIPNSAVVEAWLNGGANQLVYKLLDTDTIPFLRRRGSYINSRFTKRPTVMYVCIYRVAGMCVLFSVQSGKGQARPRVHC